MGEGEGGGQEHLIAGAAEEADRESHVGSKGSVIRSWAIMIASFAALITSLGAILKPQSHTVTEVSHDELTKSIQAIADQQQKTHDDLVALRTYIADRSGEVFVLPSQAATPTGSSSSAVILKPLVRPSPSTSVGTAPLVPASSLPPPEIHQFNKINPPTPFASVLTKAAKL